MIYRRIKNSASFYVRMKVSRMEDDSRYIVIGVTNIDEQMRQRHEEERMKEERTTYERIHALTGNFIAIYVVDPVTDHPSAIPSSTALSSASAETNSR